MSKVSEPVIIEAVAPDYWEQACAELMKHDRILKKLIPKYGSGFLRTRGDAFTTLARSIVGQQISVAAAQSVWSKVLLASKNKVNPKNILALSIEDLRAAGLSGRKVEYIRDLADHFALVVYMPISGKVWKMRPSSKNCVAFGELVAGQRKCS